MSDVKIEAVCGANFILESS